MKISIHLVHPDGTEDLPREIEVNEQLLFFVNEEASKDLVIAIANGWGSQHGLEVAEITAVGNLGFDKIRAVVRMRKKTYSFEISQMKEELRNLVDAYDQLLKQVYRPDEYNEHRVRIDEGKELIKRLGG